MPNLRHVRAPGKEQRGALRSRVRGTSSPCLPSAKPGRRGKHSPGQRHRSLVKGRAAGKENICKRLCQGDQGGLLLHSPARRGAQRQRGESGNRSPSGMGTRPDARLSTRGGNPGSHGMGWQPRQDWPLAVAPCLSLPLGTGSAKGHRLPRAPRPLCICPRALAANISAPLMLLLLNPLPTSPPQASINSFQSLLAAPWPGCFNPPAARERGGFSHCLPHGFAMQSPPG